MIVVDASVMVQALQRDGAARRQLGDEEVHVPGLIDVEIVSAMDDLVRSEVIDVMGAERALGIWRRFGVRRHGVEELATRMWELRHSLSAYDAAYVALAEALGCSFVTGDRSIAGAAGVQCPVVYVPS